MPDVALSVAVREMDHNGADETEYGRVSPMMHVLLAGGTGGVVGDTMMYPLDTVKTRQQGAASISKYSTMASATRSILSEEGLFFGVYRGYTAALIGSFPSTMLFFGAYETTKRYLLRYSVLDETVVHLTAGFLGDLASSFIYVPSEVVKTRLQLQGPYNNRAFTSGYNYRGLMDATRTIWRAEGARALFYGYKATLIRDLPFSALQLAFYEKFRSAAQRYVQSRNIGPGYELATGAAAGGLAGIITTPLDVIKTRIQTQTEGKITETVSGLKQIARTEGLLATFSGVGPRFVWTSIQSSIMLLAYQMVLDALERETIREKDSPEPI